MPEYRAYIVGSNGHIRRRIDFLRQEDDGAKEYAKQLLNGHDVELWQGRRRVATFERQKKAIPHGTLPSWERISAVRFT